MFEEHGYPGDDQFPLFFFKVDISKIFKRSTFIFYSRLSSQLLVKGKFYPTIFVPTAACMVTSRM